MGHRISIDRGLKRGFSLRGRLLAAMLTVFTLGLAASLTSYRFEVHKLVGDLHTRTLQAQIRELQAASHIGADGNITINLAPDWQQVYSDPSQQFSYTVFDPAHRPRARSPNLGTALPYIPLDVSQSLSPIDFIGAGSQHRAVLAAKNPEGYVFVVARGDIARDTLVDSLFQEDSENLLVMAPFALLALGLIWLITEWSLRPIARASREAALVGPGEPGLRISAQDLPREIRPLVDSVNGALDRLSRAYSSQRQLTADAAHELRTPLAVLNLRLQRARLSKNFDWPAVDGELNQMGRLVDQLLNLARKEAVSDQSPIAALPIVNLSRIVREAAAMVVPFMEAQGRVLAIEVPDIVSMRGRADDLRDMVRNLLDNALIHGEGTVSVLIRLPIEPSDDYVMIEVSDEGHGVPEGQEETVFERFRKLKVESPGTGLGLPIVRQVARNHGGDARFVVGQGCIVVWFPAEREVVAVPNAP